MTPLHMAAMKKDPTTLQANLKIIERLVTFGANIDSVAKDGSTPLHLACQNGAPSSVILLVILLIGNLLTLVETWCADGNLQYG